ncbi:MAG: DUF4304 domain-containing protein [Acidobacteriaceae bacterium]
MSAKTEKGTERLFKNLLKGLRPLFKEYGFGSSGQNFVLESPECWVIINFQKSRWSAPDETTFYVNVAASSKCWLAFCGEPTGKVPRCYACAWLWRAEHFGQDKSIEKWTLRDENGAGDVLAYLQRLFREFVFPSTKTMMTDIELLNHTGGFEYLQLKARSVILAATNQISPLQQAVAMLIEKFGSGAVAVATRTHLELLRSKYPSAMHSIEIQRE